MFRYKLIVAKFLNKCYNVENPPSPHFARTPCGATEGLKLNNNQVTYGLVRGALMGDTKKLMSNSSIIFVGTIVGSFCSYLFNMLMGRMLGPAIYGELTATLSLLAIVGVAGAAILTISMRYSAELSAEKKIASLQRFNKYLINKIALWSFIILTIGLLLSKPIANFLLLGETWPVVICFIIVFFALITAVNRGILQGTQRFVTISVISVFEMAIRLLLGVTMVALGLKLFGALGAILIGSIASFIITIYPIKKYYQTHRVVEKDHHRFDKKEMIAYALPALLTALVLAISINIDIILIKHYFPSEVAGEYAAISTIAKIILYITAPIVSVMFPMISEKKVKGDKHYQLFFLSLVITLIGGLIVLALYVLAPGMVISVLYGANYLSMHALLPEAGLFVLFFALSNLLVNYYLVVKKFYFLIIYGLILIIQISAITVWHDSILIIVRVLIATNALLFTALMGYYLYDKRQQILQALSK